MAAYNPTPPRSPNQAPAPTQTRNHQNDPNLIYLTSSSQYEQGAITTAWISNLIVYGKAGKEAHGRIYINVKISDTGVPRPFSYELWQDKTLVEVEAVLRSYIEQVINKQLHRLHGHLHDTTHPTPPPPTPFPKSWKIDLIFPRTLQSLLSLISPTSPHHQRHPQIPNNMRHTRINRFLKRGDTITLHVYDAHGRERWFNEDTNIWEYVDMRDEEVGMYMATEKGFDQRWRDGVRGSVEREGKRQKVGLKKLSGVRMAL